MMRYRLNNIKSKTIYSLTGLIKQLGRDPESDIVLKDPKVSRFHARLEKSEKGWVIVDLNSKNGTWVNGKAVKEQLLKPGDIIQIGNYSFQYEIDPEEEIENEATMVDLSLSTPKGLLNKWRGLKKKK